MKVTAITRTPLAIGKSLLRVQTDAGVEGWSEIPGRNNAVFNAYLESAIAPALIGEDPRLVDRHWETFALGRDERFYKLAGWVVGAIDVALWDILGKDTGLPVHALMGGARRTNIPLYWSTGSGWRMQPEEMLALVQDGWERGFRRFQDPHGLARLAAGRRSGERLPALQAGAGVPGRRRIPRLRRQQRLFPCPRRFSKAAASRRSASTTSRSRFPTTTCRA